MLFGIRYFLSLFENEMYLSLLILQSVGSFSG